ncbi:hypothetical protein ACS0TY_030696 [Phlomoides rotata]
MELKLVFAAIVLVLPILARSQGTVVYDIRDSKYGANHNADIAKIVTGIWKEAVVSLSPSKILIPEGTWMLSQLILEGQNKAPIELELRGTLQADSNVNNLPDKTREWITVNYVTNFTISGGGVFDGHGTEAWKSNNCNKNEKCAKLPYNLSFNSHNNSYFHDVTTKDSKNFHVNLMSSHNVTFQRFTVSAPDESPNTDGIHIARSNNIKVIDSIIETGDDCVSMGDDLSDVLIQNVSCGPGHGISVGSLGRTPGEKDIARITVKNCTFKGTSNGVRVKTWPSAPGTLTISDLVFEDLTMINASNPVIIDQEYCPWNLCSLDKPSLIQLNGVSVKNVRGTSESAEPVVFKCSGAKPCQNVVVGDIDLQYIGRNNSISYTSTICTHVKPTVVGKSNVAICNTQNPTAAA